VTDQRLVRIAEGMALWRLRIPGARELLSESAAALVASGDLHPSVIGLAAMYADEDWSEVDRLVTDAAQQLELVDHLDSRLDLIAARAECRKMLNGSLSARDLTRWTHAHFQHESESALIEELAMLDDEYDEMEHTGATIESLDERTRSVARRILTSVE
jgi:hypothetical protein